MNYIIFDFDGTLADSWNATLKTHAEMTGKTIVETSTEMLNHRLVTPRYTKDRIYTQAETDELMKFRKDEYELKEKHELKLFKSFVEELKKIENTKMAVVSTAYQPALDKFCTASGLSFTHVIGFGPNFSKEAKMEEITKDWGIELSDIYFVTDTIRDVVEAKTFLDPTKILGCAWGFHGADRLLEVLPKEQILYNFEDIHKFF
jgi:phosphoglycolate phosphatase-like HAD superfamily hydrolase